jgi:hypothetical protein
VKWKISSSNALSANKLNMSANTLLGFYSLFLYLLGLGRTLQWILLWASLVLMVLMLYWW